MIGITRLLGGAPAASDRLRYGHGQRPHRRPVVVWNMLRNCNLRCEQCYARAGDEPAGQLSRDQALAFIDDVADYGCPVLLFSGGEPTLHPDLVEFVGYATKRGLHAAISTNGTLIDDALAADLQAAGLLYAGVSLDGLAPTNDRIRGRDGAFAAALAGLEACQRAGIKVGIRCTLTRHNAADIEGLVDLVAARRIPRLCFYHLVYSGRGSELIAADLPGADKRAAVDRIVAGARRLPECEVLTVGNHCDGPYLYLTLRAAGAAHAEEVLALLRVNGGNSAGVGIASVGWDGQVYPDQFWRHRALGNVAERPFSAIWEDRTNPLMAKLKDKARHVGGRCATCRFLDACGGSSRVRAWAVHGDEWAEDPGCYLTDAEISED